MAKKIIIRDVAEKAGVSLQAVSIVMNNRPGVGKQTRKRILQAAESLGYVPNIMARGLRRSKSDIILWIYPVSDAGLFQRIIQGINLKVEDLNFPVFMGCTHDDINTESRLIQLLSHTGPGGILISPVPGDKNIQLINSIAQDYHTPIIQLERYNSKIVGDYIGSQNFEAAYYFTSLLIQKGHRKIGYLTTKPTYSVEAERLEGYHQALLDAGINPDPDWVLPVPSLKPWKVKDRVLSYMSDPHQPKAVLWSIARGRLLLDKITAEAGWINDENSEIIIFDIDSADFPIHQSYLSAIQDSEKIGNEAIRLLHKRMGQPADGQNAESPLMLRFPYKYSQAHVRGYEYQVLSTPVRK